MNTENLKKATALQVEIDARKAVLKKLTDDSEKLPAILYFNENNMVKEACRISRHKGLDIGQRHIELPGIEEAGTLFVNHLVLLITKQLDGLEKEFSEI